MPHSRSRKIRCVSAAISFVLAGCASIPADRGYSDVRAQSAERGLVLPRDDDRNDAAERQRITAEILSRPLTEGDAVHLAFLLSPRIAAEYASLGLSGADVIEAGRLRNPVLDGSVLFPTTSGFLKRYDLGLTQNLVELLLLPARARFSAGEFERAKLDATQRLLNLAADVQKAYYSAIGAQQIAAMRGTIASAATNAAELQSRFKDAGNSTALQLAVDTAAAGQARLDADAAEADALAARSMLNELMGLPPGTAWQLEGSLPEPASAEDSLDALQSAAKAKRADLDSDRRAVVLLEDSLGVTRDWRYLGDVQVGVQYERDTDRNHLLGPSLSLQLPLFNQGQAAVLRAEAQLDAARAALKTRELQVGNGVQRAYDRLQAARKRIDRMRQDIIPAREAIVAQTQQRVNYMLVGVFDLIRARQDEYASYQQYLEAVRDYWHARVELAEAVGSRLPSDDRIGRSVVSPVPASDDSNTEMDKSMPGMDMSAPPSNGLHSRNSDSSHDHHHFSGDAQ